MVLLKGKVIIITGGGRGIGAAMARRFAEEGARLVLLAREEQELLKVQEEIDNKTGADVLVVPGDVSVESDVYLVVEKAVERFGRIDVLVNNAGLYIEKPITECTLDEFQALVDVDLKGLFLMTKAVLPYMKQQGQGHIVNMASEVGLSGVPNQALHSMCKFGVIGFSQSLHHELRTENIKVSYICPGPTNTWDDPEPSKLLRPEDVAEAVLFVLTTHANAVVNEIIIRPLKGVRLF